jgi:hypothetical protein
MAGASAVGRVVLVAGGLLLLVALAHPATAQQALEQWLDPKMGELRPRGDFRMQWFQDRPVKNQDTDLGWLGYRLTFFSPILQGPDDEWTVSGNVELLDIDTRAILPDTGERFPDQLWDIRIGTGYRHRFENGWIAGISVNIGSPSDRPFASIDEMSFRAIALLRVPHGERNSWVFSLTYTTDQTYLEGIPVPGIAYHYNPSEALSILVGLPFTSIRYKPIEQLTLEATYVPIRRVRVRATYEVARPFRVFAGFDWAHDIYFRADRQDKDDELVYYEKRALLGARFDLRHVGFELTGGYTFDRFFYEGEKYSDREVNRIDVKSGPFVSGRISVRF